jgi:phosphoribosylformimino-5-aminoimidazole carboxamide ribotide isomerase
MPGALTIIPAIDLKGGKCVRLRQGREADATQYSDDPVEVAREWVRQGARRLHVVNLDGAFGRASGTLGILRDIAQIPNVVVEYGGGIRTMDDIREAIGSGARKVVLGTVAVEDPDVAGEAVRTFGPESIIVALDAVAGRVAVRGWKDLTEIDVIELAARLAANGVAEVLYTDIERDGMMSGPDLATLPLIARAGVRVLASGGVSAAADIAAIRAIGEPGIAGVIVGKALYEKRVTLAVLLDAAAGREQC